MVGLFLNVEIRAQAPLMLSDPSYRTAKYGVLTVRTHLEADVIINGTATGTSNVLDLTHGTKFFVGGVPENVAQTVK